MAHDSGADVFVVGSIHLDIQLDTPHLPREGETVLGTAHRRSAGGKGANQAVAAAVTGANVAFVGRIGDDAEGTTARREVSSHGVSTTNVRVDLEAATGLALITVDPSGNNQIAVSPGASGRLRASDVQEVAAAIQQAKVLLLQLEVPMATVQAAARAAGDETVVVLNPAPAAQLSKELLAHVDVLVPNLVELSQLTGRDVLKTLDDVTAAARSVPGPSVVVATMGAAGAALIDATEVLHVPPHVVDTVDATGAGDAFCGALASAIAAGHKLGPAVECANLFAANSTTRPGALTSYVDPVTQVGDQS